MQPFAVTVFIRNYLGLQIIKYADIVFSYHTPLPLSIHCCAHYRRDPVAVTQLYTSFLWHPLQHYFGQHFCSHSPYKLNIIFRFRQLWKETSAHTFVVYLCSQIHVTPSAASTLLMSPSSLWPLLSANRWALQSASDHLKQTKRNLKCINIQCIKYENASGKMFKHHSKHYDICT